VATAVAAAIHRWKTATAIISPLVVICDGTRPEFEIMKRSFAGVLSG
jgi:hypothetical protein